MGGQIDNDGVAITLTEVRAIPDDEAFLVIHVTYQVASETASLTYACDDWTDGSPAHSSREVSEGLRALIWAEVRERVDTRRSDHE